MSDFHSIARKKCVGERASDAIRCFHVIASTVREVENAPLFLDPIVKPFVANLTKCRHTMEEVRARVYGLAHCAP